MKEIPDTYWENNSKWHLIVIENNDKVNVNQFINKYVEIVNWIKGNIQAFHKHSRWTIEKTQCDCEIIKVKMRYEKDYLTFLLRWS